ETRRNYAFVVGDDGRLQGTVSIDSMLRTLQTGGLALSGAMLDDVGAVPDSMSLRDLIGRIVRNPLPLPVVDAAGHYLGAVTQTILLKKMVEEESGHE
ncbi:MAG TPA: CBS domain-containing protein, partial [Burkholderiaceae bacterium]|nr:CBS domain-containing protein [Burkholderiaceae bacterium]